MRTLTEATFYETIRGNQFALVLFGAAWCRPCVNFKGLLESKHTPNVYYVDVDKAPLLERLHNIRGVPCLRGFIDGELALERNGTMNPAYVREFEALCDEAKGEAKRSRMQ